MSINYIIEYMSVALLLVLYLSLPPIVVAALVGIIVSLLQALTQIQEQTLAFGIKLIAVSFAIYVTSSTVGEELYQFTQNAFYMIAQIR
ncbi:MAG: type III secretion system export apparatus subunit SctS [Alphaproteobacteria bacterium GM7ARS4]|nr:type III secretion system export apparatus subunit SctS [Alphaproteobacteria bacterium GM7ARS4]